MSSLQHRIAILTSLAAQLRELEQLPERVRQAEFSKRPAEDCGGYTTARPEEDLSRLTPAALWPFSSAAQPTSGSPRRDSALASSRPLKKRLANRTTPPGPIMPGGVGLGPDSAIPRQYQSSRDALRPSVQNCSSNWAIAES
jgi:hypothetical protein